MDTGFRLGDVIQLLGLISSIFVAWFALKTKLDLLSAEVINIKNNLGLFANRENVHIELNELKRRVETLEAVGR